MTKHLKAPDGTWAEVPDDWTQETFDQAQKDLAAEEAQQGNAAAATGQQPQPPHTPSPIRAMFPQNNTPQVPVAPALSMPARPTSQGRTPESTPVSSVPEMFPQDPSVGNAGAQPLFSTPAPVPVTFQQPQRPHSQLQTADSTASSRASATDTRPLFDQINDPKGLTSQPQYRLGPENPGVALNKAITTTLRGGGEIASNIGDIADFSIPRQFVENKLAAAQGQPEKPYAWPVSDAYTRWAPPVPEGYEGYNEFGKQALPIAVEAALTSGASLPESLSASGLRMTARDFAANPMGAIRGFAADPTAPVARGIAGITRAGKTLAEDPLNKVALPLAKFGTRAGVDYAGGEAGSKMGQAAGWAGDRAIDFAKKSLGYDTSTPSSLLETGGTFTGGLLTGGGIRDAANASLGFLRTDRSKSILDAFDRLNARLRAEGKPTMPLSMGLPGSKSAGSMEDWTARGITSGKPAQEARYGQYHGMEDSVRSAAADLRGGNATHKITEDTIGQDAQAMAIREDRDSRQKIADAQQAMVANSANVGPHTNPQEIHETMANIADPMNRNTGPKAKAQALLIDKEVRDSYTQPLSGIGPPQPPNYPVLKDVRSDLGQSIPEGTKLSKKVKGPAYTALTNILRRASGTSNYDAVQEWTAKRLEDLKNVLPIAKAKNSGIAYNKTFTSKTDNSLDHLKVYNQANANAPELPKLLADNLEYKLRGNNAGELPDPRTWTPDQMKNWDAMGPDARSAYTGGDENLARHLDDVSLLAKSDLSRPGARSKPGKVGSTIGMMGPLTGGAALASGTAAALGHSDIWPLITTGLVGAGAGSALANRALGSLLTNEKFVRHVVNNAPMTGLRRAGSGGAGLSVLLQNQEAQNRDYAAKQKQQALDDARIRRMQETGGVE